MTMLRQSKSITTECVVGRSKMSFEYVPAEDVVFLQHLQPLALAKKKDIDDYFDTIRQFWRMHCNGQKMYWVINLDNLAFEAPKELAEHYAKTIREGTDECILTAVRYGGSMLQRITTRMAAIQRHESSNVYASRDEALAVVRAIRAGTLEIAPPRSATR